MAREEAQGHAVITDTSTHGISSYVKHQSREVVNQGHREDLQPEREVYQERARVENRETTGR